jgi:hypothetical protein
VVDGRETRLGGIRSAVHEAHRVRNRLPAQVDAAHAGLGGEPAGRVEIGSGAPAGVLTCVRIAMRFSQSARAAEFGEFWRVTGDFLGGATSRRSTVTGFRRMRPPSTPRA